MATSISLIGAPTDIGAGTRGASMGPEALRVAGLQQALQDHGLAVSDRGNLSGPPNPWLPPENGYRHLDEVVAWNQTVHAAVLAELPAGQLPILLGGDHLGPNPWAALPAEAAMRKAEAMIAAYASAGFSKLHLDCSMACADDPTPLPEATIVQRAVRLCRAAEVAYAQAGGPAPVYVIGTEVPVPGGANEVIEDLEVTTPDAALATIEAHRAAFLTAGLEAAWARVIASVVQPGVEFDHHNVIAYAPANAQALSAAIARQPGMVFEAHSTDYQTRAALKALVRDHFAILKVGPGLTFALREALWALDAIEREWVADAQRAHLRAITLTRLHAEPKYWQRYYHAQDEQLHIDLQYSLSDRIRYYWPDAMIEGARLQLFDNLRSNPPPLALIGQYLPHALLALREGRISNTPDALVMAHIDTVLDDYLHACH